MSLFKLQNINLKKENNIIFKNLNLEIPDEKIVCIMGASGSGKTTLLRFLNRLEDPQTGEIFYKTKSLYQMPVLNLRRQVGMLFQTPALPQATVFQNINYGPSLLNQNLNENEIGTYLNQVDLSHDVLHRKAGELSVGQQQRVGLARLLANKSDVLLLDEPTASLDESTTIKIEKTLLKCVENNNIHVVWVTHNLNQAQRLSKTIIQLEVCDG